VEGELEERSEGQLRGGSGEEAHKELEEVVAAETL
jgi:hypothetical protein